MNTSATSASPVADPRLGDLVAHFHSGRPEIECSHTDDVRPCEDEARALLASAVFAAPAPTPASAAPVVWLAIALLPDSTEVHAATTRDAAIDAIRDTIPAEEWNAYQESLARHGEPGADLTFDAPAADVVQHFYGTFEDAGDDVGEDTDADPGAFWVGESYLVRPTLVHDS